MCGIFGVINNTSQPLRVGYEKLLDTISHRGPDEKGGHYSAKAFLGMTRLSIIDIEGGQQPIYNEDRSILLVCNGEIYNYGILKEELLKKGHVFSTNSDVEVILHLYEEYQESCFTYLNGMFSAAIYDIPNHRLTLARDPFGQKPLYYHYTEQKLYFGSELKLFNAIDELNLEIDNEGIAHYLRYRYISHPKTPYKNIQKLSPGRSLTFCHDEIKIHPYFCFLGSESSSIPTIRSKEDSLYDLVMNAVQRHLMSEKPVGLFLSGGMDSAILLHCMSKLSDSPIHTFSVGFVGYELNETDNARLLSQKYNTIHHEVIISEKDFWIALDEVVYCLDEPMADLTCIPLYLLAKEAKKFVTVVLSGEGSDELFAGYRGFRRIKKQLDHRRNYLDIVDRLSFLPDYVKNKMSLLFGSSADILKTHGLFMTNVFRNDEFITDEFQESLDGGIEGVTSKEYLQEVNKFGNKFGFKFVLAQVIKYWLPDDLLHKADRVTMAHSIEVRSPFLDIEISCYARQMSNEQLIDSIDGRSGLEQKAILKKAFQGHVPDTILFQEKKGFVIPAYGWIRNELKDCIAREIEDVETSHVSSFIKAESIRRIYKKSLIGDIDSQHKLWSIIILKKWMEVYGQGK